MKNDDKGRRRFLGTMIGAATAAALTTTRTSTAATAKMDMKDAWLDGLDGPHRCLFDFPQHKRGAGLVHIRNYVLTYIQAYGADVSDINTIGTFYAIGPNSSLPMGFTDAMWEKYRFGEYLELTDPQTGKPAVRNLFYETLDGDELPRVGPLGPFPDSSVSAMQANMGTTFLMCNNAVVAISLDLARLGHGEPADIEADLKNHIHEGVHLVPAMVIAIERAQKAGISYNKQ